MLQLTSEWYFIVKIAGIKLCQAYRKQYGRRYVSVLPCNVYGPFDNFDVFTSHVLPALMYKFHELVLQNGQRSRSGAPALPCGSSCTWTTCPREPYCA